MRRLRDLIGMLACGLLASLGAQAAPITYSFTASLTDDPFGLSHYGALISGSYTFDPTAPDLIADAATGSYRSTGAAYGFSADVDGTAYTAFGSLFVNTANQIVGVDQYGVLATEGALTLELFLQDATGLALSSDALPSTAPSLGLFDVRQFRLFGDDVEFFGTVDRLACTTGCAPLAVPEPVVPLLAGVGAACAMVIRRRRQRALAAGSSGFTSA
jgi:hypothetical protein